MRETLDQDLELMCVLTVLLTAPFVASLLRQSR